jgi:hypothetical protein
MISIRWTQAVAALAAASLCGAAWGQYVWLNEQGTKQFSDMPPPASVPKNRILKSPDGAPRAAEASPPPAKADNAATGTRNSDSQPRTLAERNAEFQKRRIEQEEKDKKAAEEEKVAAAKARNCEQARSYQRTLVSGERIVSTTKNGERTYLDDSARSRELRETQAVLHDCK